MKPLFLIMLLNLSLGAFGQASDSLVFTVVQSPPAFPGGMEAFSNYFQRTFNYPLLAESKGVEGSVFVQFIIDKNGTTNNVKVIKGIGFGCDEAAKMIIKGSPNWIPGKQRGEIVRVRIVLLFSFKLNGNSYVRMASSNYNPDIIYPTYLGGTEKFSKYLNKNKKELSFPLPINKLGDNVHVEFLVDTFGLSSNIKVSSGLGEPFDSEAIRLISEVPHWNPGTNSGKKIKELAKVYVNFSIIDKDEFIKADGFYYRSINYLKINEFESSLKFINKAIEKNPTYYKYYLNRGFVNLSINKVKEGCKDLELIKDIDQEALSLFNQYCR